MTGVFIAGTDTGVGKTFVAAALCLALRGRGRSVVGLKPFESGCDPEPADAQILERAAHSGLPLTLRCPIRYRQPLAPAVAAESEGSQGTLAKALASLRRAAQDRFAVVEGAGGLLVPLDGERTVLDLAAMLGLPVVLVARDALGTINQTALSVMALRRRRLTIGGIVLSRPRTSDPSQRTNARWVRRMTKVEPVVTLPRLALPEAGRRLVEELGLELLS